MSKPKSESQNSQAGKAHKQTTLAGFFSKPVTKSKPLVPPGLVQSPSTSSSAGGPSNSSPISATLQTPTSEMGSSPLTARPVNSIHQGKGVTQKRRAESPLKTSFVIDDEDEQIPSHSLLPVRNQPVESVVRIEEKDEAGMRMDLDDDSPVLMRRRASKRKVLYTEPDSDASSGEDIRKKG
ncbi:hypothetical protein TREMEDRAFT_57371, partial [Tremella mesenterica DSM 1558]|uniref:uncharacterized protein n=1 Tax=Tremella mesenterica (strain ATCC 24925 / CBS 8224 / DSM 1558 / NBRC 9311 / NRRL Y-6157 / RJB 2259-6 / UBC 559-6) TaxID=578456 RepID=UPI0003F4926F